MLYVNEVHKSEVDLNSGINFMFQMSPLIIRRRFFLFHFVVFIVKLTEKEVLCEAILPIEVSFVSLVYIHKSSTELIVQL